MNGLMITGIILLILGIIAAAVGGIFIVKQMMDIRGALVIVGGGLLILIISVILIAVGNHQQKQAQLIRQQQILMTRKKEKAKKELFKKKQAEEKHKKLMGLGSSEVPMRQLGPQQYAMTPQTIYRMYTNKGQDFFDAQYDDGDSKNYALKHIGLTLPDLHFRTLTGQTATIDNLAGDNKKVVLALIHISYQKDNHQIINNTSQVESEISLLQGMSLNYPKVNFIMAFPNVDRKIWNAFTKNLDDESKQDLKGYKLITLGGDNPNIGANYGSLNNFAVKTLNWNNKDVLITIDKHDRIALTEYGQFANGNSSDDGQALLTRFINLSFASNDSQKVYNMLKPQSVIDGITKAGEQGLTNDDNDNNVSTNIPSSSSNQSNQSNKNGGKLR